MKPETQAHTPKYKMERRIVDEPLEGESGTIYEYVIKDEWGAELAVTYDDDLARLATAAPDMKQALEKIVAMFPPEHKAAVMAAHVLAKVEDK